MEFHRPLSEKRSTRSTLKRRSTKSSMEKQLSVIETIEEDGFTIVKDIMQEILTNALDQIYITYMENQTIKLVVHCAQQALSKALKIHFYQHNNYIRDREHWGSDRRAAPSAPDSWAMGQTPINKTMTELHELNTLSLIKLDVTTKGGEIDVGPDVELASPPSKGLLDDIRAMLDDIINNLPIVDEESIERADSTISAFTAVVEGSRHYMEFKMKPQLSKISVGNAAFRLPRIDLPESGNSTKQMSWSELEKMGKLPPIRTDAKYKCLSNSPDDKPKKPQDRRQLT